MVFHFAPEWSADTVRLRPRSNAAPQTPEMQPAGQRSDSTEVETIELRERPASNSFATLRRSGAQSSIRQ